MFAKALDGVNVKEMISNISSGVGAAPAGGAAPAAAEAPAEKKAAKEEKKEESESDEDMGFGEFPVKIDMLLTNIFKSNAQEKEGYVCV
ncbi:60S acidic ribosomal protein P1 isoform X3 [Ostrea edulis]|nr:60S acidic ribosomal protein P1 isoform X3 [Ostrea edulis]